MVIQIDIDGTIDRAPAFFQWITSSLKRDGHRVLIVTSRTHSPQNLRATANELAGLGIVYDSLILTPPPDSLNVRRIPRDMHPAHKLFINKLFAAEDNDVDAVFDDCGITADLFRRYLPEVQVFRVLERGSIRGKR
jgi:hypothetical protein